MQRFQKSFNAFIEQFQERWETQPAFRTTWSLLGVGTFMIILCVGAMIGSNIFSGFFAGAGDVNKGSVIVAGANNVTAFPNNNPTPQGTDATGSTPIAVATTTYSPSPTPTVTPSQPTPSPTDTGTPTGNTFTVKADQAGTWKNGQTAILQNFAVTGTPQPANVTMTVDLQFGASQGCRLPAPLTVQLDDNGNGVAPNSQSFTIPLCNKGNNQVTVTYHIDGYTDYPDMSSFHTS